MKEIKAICWEFGPEEPVTVHSIDAVDEYIIVKGEWAFKRIFRALIEMSDGKLRIVDPHNMRILRV